MKEKEVIAKEEVYSIIDKMYEMVDKSIRPGLIGNVIKGELFRFCNLVKEQIEKTGPRICPEITRRILKEN